MDKERFFKLYRFEDHCGLVHKGQFDGLGRENVFIIGTTDVVERQVEMLRETFDFLGMCPIVELEELPKEHKTPAKHIPS